MPFTDDLCAVAFDEAAPERGRSQPRLTALLDGEIVARPLISTRLELSRGGCRHLMLLGRNAGELARHRLLLALGSKIAAGIDPDWLQDPLADRSALVEGVSEAGRRRLLQLFLTTGASLFRDRQTPAFAEGVRSLIELAAGGEAGLACWFPIGGTARVLSFRTGAGWAAEFTELVAVAPERVTRIGRFDLRHERSERGGLLHLFLPQAISADAMLVGLGRAPVMLRGADLAPQPLAPWLARRDEPTRRWLGDRIEAAAEADAGAADLLRELRFEAGAPPALALRHLSGTPGGILFAFDLTDPHGLVRAVRIERGAAAQDIPIGAVAPGPLAGFAALPRESVFADKCRVRLVYLSGRLRSVHEGQLAPFGGAVPRGMEATPAAVAEARLTLERRFLRPAVETIGTAPARPRLSLIAGVGSNLDLIRARAAALIGEPATRKVELIYHMPDTPETKGARHAAAHAHAVFGLAHKLVTLPAEADPAERLRAALAVATADAVLVLGAEVLPAGPGWLAAWLRGLGEGKRPKMLGGVLLGPDGSVLHAGGRVAAADRGTPARLDKSWSGLPAHHIPRSASRRTGLLTADCVGLTRGAVEAVLACGLAYPNPDILLADAARRLGGSGTRPRTLLASRLVRYGEPADPLEEAVDARALCAVDAGVLEKNS